MGGIDMAASLGDPAGIGASLALCLLSVLYGILLAEVLFQPLKNRLTKEPAHKESC